MNEVSPMTELALLIAVIIAALLFTGRLR